MCVSSVASIRFAQGGLMATPNSEQLKAIEHTGGVLLKAGAGSGKTFVLKEHMIYLTKEWIKEYKSEPIGDFDQYIKSKFRKVVLMTFTKKAAGELEIRLFDEFQEIYNQAIESNEDINYWSKVLDGLSYLTVGTIHSFCFKLIKQGHFPNISAGQDILSEVEFKAQIEEIFAKWAQENVNNEIVSELLLKDYGNVLSALQEILMDPTLRLSWRESSSDSLVEQDLAEVTNDIIDMFSLKDFFEQSINMSLYEEFEGQKWYQFLQEFLANFSEPEQSYHGLVKLYHYFKGRDFKIPNKPSEKKVNLEMVEYYVNIKNMKDFLKANGEDLSLFVEAFDEYVSPWFRQLKELFDFVEAEYLESEGVTFSDLEYLVYQGVSKPDTAKAISEQYEYFIVDEFQDTSYIQFSILEKLIQGDFSRLFCVGDLKQAIYGFRGGELGVFLECEKKVPRVLSLLNNYRSTSNVINYNNYFFDELFQKGMSFTGRDQHTVPVDYQNVPETQEKLGAVYQLDVDLDFINSEEKIANKEIDYIEALAIFTRIKEDNQRTEKACVLYKRLKPSLIMIDLLIQNDLGFTSQVKVPYLEDPIMGIFYTLIEAKFNKSESSEEFILYAIQAYLSLLSGKSAYRVRREDIDLFNKNRAYFGLYHVYLDFLGKLKIKTSNYSNNLINIQTLINDSSDNDELLYLTLKGQSAMSYSLDFQYGKNPELINMMSAHASKGLQFQHVYLGGIYTNENIPRFTSMVGKYPLSFKWSKSIHDKKKFKTPFYLVEGHLRKQKEFSESKRLFYVANTRAEETLSYVNIHLGDRKFKKPQSGAWVNGIRSIERPDISQHLEIVDINISQLYSSAHLARLEFEKPLFHIDNIGIEQNLENSASYYLPELSVTRLASLADCPRKFYLKNIIKLGEEDISLLNFNEDTFESDEIDEEIVDLSSKNISSASRGSFIHEELSKVILSEFNYKPEGNTKDSKVLIQAVEKLREFSENYKFISEKMIKFELFNYMISGIPDLILSPNSNQEMFEIWDFKTGRYSEEKLKPYFFQLYTYAYAVYILNQSESTNSIKMVLYFVDENKLVEKIASRADVENYLTTSLERLNYPEQMNTDHCEYCQYQNLCQK